MGFHVGQKVVCVDDLPRVKARVRGWFSRYRRWTLLDHNLNKGDVYRVVKIEHWQDALTHEVFEVLHVDDARNFRPYEQMGFPSFQFRPLIERKTSIEVFTRLLTPSPKQTEKV